MNFLRKHCCYWGKKKRMSRNSFTCTSLNDVHLEMNVKEFGLIYFHSWMPQLKFLKPVWFVRWTFTLVALCAFQNMHENIWIWKNKTQADLWLLFFFFDHSMVIDRFFLFTFLDESNSLNCSLHSWWISCRFNVSIFLFKIMRLYDEIKSMFITLCFFSYVFLISGLLVNFVQLCSCAIWPFSKQLYRKINCYLALAIWSRS